MISCLSYWNGLKSSGGLPVPRPVLVPGYYTRELIQSDVVVTNTREIYNDHISAHIMAFLLAFARGFQVYIPQQVEGAWRQGYQTIYLPEATAAVVGVGGIGSETARLCSEFGMTVLGVDPRLTEPSPGMAELHRPDALLDVLPRADFVLVTVPETPETQGMFALDQFRAMKNSAFIINIGRGATVVLDDLLEALRAGEIAGAGLDVFQVEPLPAGHPLWTAPGGPYHASRGGRWSLPGRPPHGAVCRKLQTIQRGAPPPQRGGQGQLVLGIL